MKAHLRPITLLPIWAALALLLFGHAARAQATRGKPLQRTPTASASSDGAKLDKAKPVKGSFAQVLAKRGIIYREWGPNSSLSLSVSPSVAVKLGSRTGAVVGEDVPAGEFQLAPVPADVERTKAERIESALKSPKPALDFLPGIEGVDAGIAVGHKYLMVAQDHNLAFFDKEGKPLPSKAGFPTSMSTNTFFGGFIAPNNADGTQNYHNINRYLGFPRTAPIQCDWQAQPLVFPCVNEFYDARVLYDSASRRFFVLAAARHQLWVGNEQSNPGGIYDALVRRYVAFAVSKTEDPRDGFHQYMLLESNRADWPRIALNGDSFIIAGANVMTADAYAAYVVSAGDMRAGTQDPRRFRLGQSAFGVKQVVAVTHQFPGPAGHTLFVAPQGKQLTVFALPNPGSGFKPKPIKQTSVTLERELSMLRSGAFYQGGKIHLTTVLKVKPGNGTTPDRFSVRVVRLPTKISGGTLTASTSPQKGFLDTFFGRNALEDDPEDLISYEMPSMAVNNEGTMFFGYGRSPVTVKKVMYPEARYSVWYADETKPRRSRLLKAGTFQPTKGNGKKNFMQLAEFMWSTVDPADNKTFWTAQFFGDPSQKASFKTVVGKVKP